MLVMRAVLGLAVLGSVAIDLSLGTSATANPQAGTPAALQGRWIWSTVSNTSYWNGSNGQYLGNGNASGIIYQFDSKGNYRSFVVVNMRMYSSETKYNNDFTGKVTFTGDKVTFQATSGTYRSETDGQKSSHPASKEDLSRASATYKYRMDKGDDGKPRFVVISPNGKESAYQRL